MNLKLRKPSTFRMIRTKRVIDNHENLAESNHDLLQKREKNEIVCLKSFVPSMI